MSVITKHGQNASSSRIEGLYRYMLIQEGQTATRSHILNVFSPSRLVTAHSKTQVTLDRKPGPVMIEDTLKAAIAMGLLQEDEGQVTFHQDLPPEARDISNGEVAIHRTLACLMLRPGDDNPNANLARQISWFLAQDLRKASWDWDRINQTLLQEDKTDYLELKNNARFSQFEDWIRYLGFAWSYGRPKASWLMPDPTAFLRRALPELTAGVAGATIPLSDFAERLKQLSPVFEGGFYRNDVEARKLVAERSTDQFSASTSLALYRLQDEGLIELQRFDDGDIRLLFEDGIPVQFTHVTFLSNSKAEGPR